MLYIAPDGTVFRVSFESYAFTREPLVVLRGLTDFLIDGESVAGEVFRGEIMRHLERKEIDDV